MDYVFDSGNSTNNWRGAQTFLSSVTFSSGAYIDGNLVVKGSGTVMGVLISTTGFIGGSSTMTHLSLPVGSVGGPSLSLGDAITGFYTNGSQAINVAINGALAYTFGTFAGAVSFFPGLDSVYNLGNGANRWNIGNFGTGLTSPALWGGSGTTQTLTFKPTTGAGTTGADMIFQVGNNGGTEAMRILNSGNVGIGITAPTSALHVAGGLTASTGAFISSATAFGGFTSTTGFIGNGSTFTWLNVSNSINLNGANINTAGTLNVAYLNASNTFTSGGQAVNTSGNSTNTGMTWTNTTSGTSAGERIYLTAGTADALLYVLSQGYTTNGAYAASSGVLDGDAAGGLSLIASHASGQTRFYTGGNNERMRIDNSGNVGIGTPGPIAALDVTANTFPLLNLKRAGAAVITVNDSNNKRWDIGESGVIAGDFSFQNITDSITPLHIKSNGKVGIGTTSPSSLVDVSGGSITIRGTNAGLSIAGGPATGGALCLNASNALSKCTSAVDINGDCTCP